MEIAGSSSRRVLAARAAAAAWQREKNSGNPGLWGFPEVLFYIAGLEVKLRVISIPELSERIGRDIASMDGVKASGFLIRRCI
jgi:hypothetical protein